MLSKRLMAIANMVPSGIKVADVGCDHGFLDIYLTLHNNNACTAIDKSNACIMKTAENIAEYELTDRITVLRNDGLNGLDSANYDLIVMAGLGIKTFYDVLKNKYVNNVIIQINDDMFKLRRKISELKYKVIDEVVIFEKKKYYIVMKLEKGYEKYKYKDYLLGPIIRTKNENIIKDYYLDYLSIFMSALKCIPKRDIFKRIKYQKKVVTIKRMLVHFD